MMSSVAGGAAPEPAKRNRFAGAFPVDESGATLVMVMAIITAVLLIGSALFILGTGEADVVEHGADGAMAFGLAEGGIERARTFLEGIAESGFAMNPVGTTFEDQSLGGGSYTTTIESELTGGSWVRKYRVLSTGWKDGVPRQVRVTLQEQTFSHYQWFINQGGWRWFLTGERFGGPVHVNYKLQIDGDPWFGAKVTATHGLSMKQGSNPTFEAGYELFVDPIELPTFAEVTSALMPPAQNAGIYEGNIPGNDTRYEVEFGRDGIGTLSYRSYSAKAGYSSWSVEDLASLNGAAWFADDVWVKGILDGQITIAAEGDIWVTGDILYDDSTPGSGPDPDCDDMLGLIARDDVVIAATPENMSECEIHGVLMALWRDFLAEDYQHGPPRGDLTIYGGTMVEQSWHIAQYQHGALISGYSRNFQWDDRLESMWPPLFPKTGQYFVREWEEIIPPNV